MEGWIEEWFNEEWKVGLQRSGSMEELKVGWMGGLMEEQKVRCVDELMDKQKVGWLDRWMD